MTDKTIVPDEQTILEMMRKLQRNIDTEMAHEEADTLLCLFLRHLGYHDIVDAYIAVDKWYA